MAQQDVQFWHQHLGQYLSDADESMSSQVLLPTRINAKDKVTKAKLGHTVVASQRLGSCGVTYLVTPEKAIVIGTLEIPSTDKVEVIGRDKVEGFRTNKFVAKWLVEHAKAPFLIGEMSNANPQASFKVSAHDTRCYFCAPAPTPTLAFNLEIVRETVQVISDYPFKQFLFGFYQYHAMESAGETTLKTEIAKMDKLLASSPDGLIEILSGIRMLPKSAELEVVKWLLS